MFTSSSKRYSIRGSSCTGKIRPRVLRVSAYKFNSLAILVATFSSCTWRMIATSDNMKELYCRSAGSKVIVVGVSLEVRSSIDEDWVCFCNILFTSSSKISSKREKVCTARICRVTNR